MNSKCWRRSKPREEYHEFRSGRHSKETSEVVKSSSSVYPFYAVKCSDSRTIVKTPAVIGMGFDYANKTEIQLVQSLGVPPGRIIYANLCKQVFPIKYDATNGIQMMTFDSEVKLMKVASSHPKAKLVLRIAKQSVVSVLNLVPYLKPASFFLEQAKELNIDVIGVSFHMGSGCTDSEILMQAISDAHCVFDMEAEEQTGSDDEDELSEKTFMYYMSDGVYRSFNCIFYDHGHMKRLLQKSPKPDERYSSSSLWDQPVTASIALWSAAAYPRCMWGDWMLFENMGAYTIAAASIFNGFQRQTIYYVMSGSAWQLMWQVQNDFQPEAEKQKRQCSACVWWLGEWDFSSC
ncbi:hypothetical protein QTO34_006954 [Cnephaeus nilssonii]|uniref:Ornithine decarboxylase n=1 Tax=Cnephaeus nilssonii TaxID=3371016 RepID=A0AA40LHB9_CNENI|nr:hypothetical protein QTO34_006954 [Eptesicus nilssonii]